MHSSSQSVSHLNSVYSFKIQFLQMLQLFQTKNGSFFFHHHTYMQWLHSFSLHNALYTLVTLFHQKTTAPIAQLVECPLRGTGGHGFDPGSRHTKVIKHTFLCFIRKYLSHIVYCAQHVSVCFSLKLCFRLYNTLSANVTVVSDKEGVIFFIVTLLYSGYIAFPFIMHSIHLSHFLKLHQKYLSQIFYCTQLVSVCFILKLCLSVSHLYSVFFFKMHCLKML